MFKRLILTAAAALLGAGAIAHAQTAPAPIVVYNDALGDGWQNWSWATVTLQVPAGNVQPIKVEGGPWSGLVLHHAPIYTKGYSRITFYINGGTDGGQTLAVKVNVDGKALDKTVLIQPKAKTWSPVSVSLKDIGGQDVNIDGILIQGQADAYKPYYIDKIQIE
jgi:chitinase